MNRFGYVVVGYVVALALLAWLPACLEAPSSSDVKIWDDGPDTRKQIDPKPHDPPQPQDPTHGLTNFTECDLGSDDVELLWFHQHGNEFSFGNDSRERYLGFGPKPGLLASGSTLNAQGAVFLYALGGNLAFHAPLLLRNGLDKGWNFRVEENYTTPIEVRWLVTDEVVFTAEAAKFNDEQSDVNPRMTGSLTRAGDRLITLTCGSGAGLKAIVSSFALPSGEPGPEVLLENFNCKHYPRRALLDPSPDGKSAVLVGTVGTELVHVNLETGKTHRVDVLGGQEDVEPTVFFFSGPTVFDMAFHPSGDKVATTSSDGMVRIWSLPELIQIGDDIPSRLEPINQNTYMPDAVSAIGWSPDGKLLAHISDEGEVVLRDWQVGTVVAVLERAGIPSDGQTFLPSNSVTRFAFNHDGSALAIRYTGGTAIYGCASWDIEGEGRELDVLIEGPVTLAVGEAGTFIATHINGDDVHGHQFFVNDVAVSNMSMSREFAWTPEKAGTFDVTVLVDDGFSIGEATMQINVE